MRYFKCGKINTDENEILKAQYAKLCAREQKFIEEQFLKLRND